MEKIEDRIKKLSSCQKKALKELLGKDNIFLSGSAGSGKTTLINLYMDILEKKEVNYFITASTGRAAILVNGITFHSFFGLGIMQEEEDALIYKATNIPKVKNRIEKAEIIIVDEVSMLTTDALRCAEQICSKIKQRNLYQEKQELKNLYEIAKQKNAINPSEALQKEMQELKDKAKRRKILPWGGIKIILVADFCQLPPIQDKIIWAFTDPIWEKTQLKTVYLKTIMRTQDLSFIDILNDVREGEVTPRVRNFLASKIISKELADDSTKIPYPRIFGYKKQVESFNLKELEKIKSPKIRSETIFKGSEQGVAKLKKEMPDHIIFKVGALIMVTVNKIEEGYHNGTLGIVTSITNEQVRVKKLDGFEIALEPFTTDLIDTDKNGKKTIIASATQFPLILGWSVTAHRVQGATLEGAVLDLRNLFAFGQAYTMLSRLTSSKHLYIRGFDEDSIFASPKVLKFYKEIERQNLNIVKDEELIALADIPKPRAIEILEQMTSSYCSFQEGPRIKAWSDYLNKIEKPKINWYEYMLNIKNLKLIEYSSK